MVFIYLFLFICFSVAFTDGLLAWVLPTKLKPTVANDYRSTINRETSSSVLCNDPNAHEVFFSK